MSNNTLPFQYALRGNSVADMSTDVEDQVTRHAEMGIELAHGARPRRMTLVNA